MTVENISWSVSTKECCRPRRGLNPRPPGLQSDGASNWATEVGSYGHDSYFQSELNWTVIYLEIGFTNSGLISEGHFLCPGKWSLRLGIFIHVFEQASLSKQYRIILITVFTVCHSVTTSQRAYGVYTTPPQRRCSYIDVVATLYKCHVSAGSLDTKQNKKDKRTISFL